MTDELHVELIEAGFYGEKAKEPEHFCPFADCCGASLEELIAACGEAYFVLQYITTDDEGWMASKYAGQPGKFKSVGYCRTPSEAVAKLWLALHPKR